MGRKKNIVLEHVSIIGTAAKGKALAKHEDGRVIFIKEGVPGDVVDLRVVKKRKNYFEAEIIKLHKGAPNRITPVCSHFGVCGGCKWQHMTYELQLEQKQQEVVDNLERIAKVNVEQYLPIKGAEETFFYRNKMEYSFSDSRWLTQDEINSEETFNRNALGFHVPGKWDKIVQIDKCHLQEDIANNIRNFCKQEGELQQLNFFNPRNQSGHLRTLMIRNSSKGELMVLVQFFKASQDEINNYMQAIAAEFPQIKSLLYTVNSKANDTIYDQEISCFKGEAFIFEEMEGLEFRIDAKSFYQTNSKQAYELYKIIRSFADLKGDEVVYDLYTGTGTIALFLAAQAKEVVGVESVTQAILNAQWNAKHNEVTNVSFETGDMKKVFNDNFIARHGAADVVITDPPRDGMHSDVVHQLIKLSAPKVVYVSCNSATQARDLALLDPYYKVIKSQAVDMFPQTHHIENVVLLEKRI
jgi:23S rRNA (uracil1939-C5)-methyltransferase